MWHTAAARWHGPTVLPDFHSASIEHQNTADCLEYNQTSQIKKCEHLEVQPVGSLVAGNIENLKLAEDLKMSGQRDQWRTASLLMSRLRLNLLLLRKRSLRDTSGISSDILVSRLSLAQS
jgi:hypothetical protein